MRGLAGPVLEYVKDPTHRIVLRGAAQSISVRIAGVALSYVATLILSRVLGLAEYGHYAIALSWVLVLALPAKAGFDNSSLRYATIYIEHGNHRALRAFILFAASVVAVTSLAMGAVIVEAGERFAHVDQRLLLWAALMVMPLALLALFSVLMRTACRIVASQFYEQMLRPLLVIAGIGTVAASGAIITAADALMITTLAAFVTLAGLLIHFRAAFSDTWHERPDLRAWRQWLAVSIPMLVMGVVQELMNYVEVIFLGLLADAQQAGLFAASWRVASLVPFMFVGLSTMGAPLIASAHERGAFDEMRRVSTLVARLGFASAALGALALLLFGRWLLGLFGSEFVAAYPVLAVLLVGGAVNALTGMVGYLMILTGRERIALVIFTGALALSIVLNLVFIPRWGALGAAIASSSATTAWNLAMLVFVRRTIGIDASALALRPRGSARD